MGPEAGSSRGKKKYTFSPLTLVKSHFFENSCIRPKSYRKCCIYKLTHSLTTFFFLLIAFIWHIVNDMILFMSGLSCLEICEHPGRLDKLEKFKLSEKFSFILSEKIENFDSFVKFENFAKFEESENFENLFFQFVTFISIKNMYDKKIFAGNS